MININDIRRHIAEFELGQYSIAERFFEENEDLISWFITRRCNFKCNYCLFPCDKEEPDFDLQTIKNSFNRNGKKWHILITGGEPFIKKNIIEILEILTEKHDILLNTNLSTSNVDDFAERINPEKVLSINIGCHVVAREKYDKGFKKFIRDVNVLQEKNFLLFVTYVFHPDLIGRIDKDFEFFRASGIKKISLKPMFGTFNNKVYPDAYTKTELEYLEKYYDPELDLGDEAKATKFTNTLCLAGWRTFYIDEQGVAHRCENCGDSYGNFFDNTFSPDKKPRKCNSPTSQCPFQCIFYAKQRQVSFWEKLLGKTKK